MAALTRAAILGGPGLRTIALQVPEFGGEVLIRELTGQGRDAYEYFVNTTAKGNWRNVRARLVMLSVVDEAGAEVFQDTDLEAVGQLSAAGLDRVFKAALTLNRIGADDVDDLEKN